MPKKFQHIGPKELSPCVKYLIVNGQRSNKKNPMYVKWEKEQKQKQTLLRRELAAAKKEKERAKKAHKTEVMSGSAVTPTVELTVEETAPSEISEVY
jgi:hypothetical protein